MEEPEERIRRWRKHIKDSKDESMLNAIKIDLEAELDIFEETISLYEDLISEVEDKMKEASSKKSKN